VRVNYTCSIGHVFYQWIKLNPVTLCFYLFCNCLILSMFSLAADEGMRRMVKRQRKNQVEILASLKVTDDLIDQLVEANCISDRQRNHLKKSPLSKRSRRLLNTMILKNIEEYRMFINIMRRTGRQHIAVLLGMSLMKSVIIWSSLCVCVRCFIS